MIGNYFQNGKYIGFLKNIKSHEFAETEKEIHVLGLWFQKLKSGAVAHVRILCKSKNV